jgi:hypothetical protein
VSIRPVNVVVLPSGATTTAAGCERTPKRAYTSPGSSLIWSNVSECLSTNDWNESSSPNQATPTNAAVPLHRVLASSTEGASELHVLQPGAQNQNTVGFPASAAPSKVPPDTNGAEKFSSSGTATAGVVGATVAGAAVSAEGGAVASTLAGASVIGAAVVGAVVGAVVAGDELATESLVSLPHAVTAARPTTTVATRRWRRLGRPERRRECGRGRTPPP